MVEGRTGVRGIAIDPACPEWLAPWGNAPSPAIGTQYPKMHRPTTTKHCAWPGASGQTALPSGNQPVAMTGPPTRHMGLPPWWPGIPQKKLNETDTSNLSDKEFEVMAIRMLKQLSEKYKEINEIYKEL